ncbi:MAG: hypothetical protein WEG40_10110 [Candidatus Rokuibacteriota bacterium]
MNPEKDLSRINLRAAKLCMELDCNTVFDAAMYRHCPTCGSVEFYPLEAWLNRERSPRAPAALDTRKFTPRALWLGRLRERRAARAATEPLKLHARALRRRAG